VWFSFGSWCCVCEQVNLIVANEITPHLTAEEYLDKGEYENELKQVRSWARRAPAPAPVSVFAQLCLRMLRLCVCGKSCIGCLRRVSHSCPSACGIYVPQVVGDTQAAFDITQYDTLVFGANGLLLAGPNSRTYEPLLASYLQLISMDLFVRNLFTRILVILDDFKEVRSPVLFQYSVFLFGAPVSYSVF
jgi:hypothetical protein